MPTVLSLHGYRFYFYANEGAEPPHIHVISANGGAKFWLIPVRLSYSKGYNSRELKQLETLVIENASLFLKAWHSFFGAS